MAEKLVSRETLLVTDENGEVLTHQEKTISQTYSKERSERFAFIFIEKAANTLGGTTGDESKLFSKMLGGMDDMNMIEFSPSSKQKFVFEYLYLPANKDFDTKCSKSKNQASRRFSQLIAGLTKKGLICPKDSYTYKVNPEVVAYGFNGMKGIEEQRKEFITMVSTVDLTTGRIKSKIKATNEGEQLNDAYNCNDGFERGED